jgi:hypothetical protein
VLRDVGLAKASKSDTGLLPGLFSRWRRGRRRPDRIYDPLTAAVRWRGSVRIPEQGTVAGPFVVVVDNVYHAAPPTADLGRLVVERY